MNPSAPVLTCLECWLLLWGSTRIVGAMGSTQDPSDQPSSSSLSNGCVGFEYHISVHSFFSLSPFSPYSLKLFYMVPSLLSYTSSTSWSQPNPPLFEFFLFFFSFCPLFSSALSSTRIFCHFFSLSNFSFSPLFVSFLCLFTFLSPLNQSVALLNFECVSSVDVLAISAAEDEAVEGGVSWEESLHAAGRSRLLLRCSRSDAAFLFWGDNPIKN